VCVGGGKKKEVKKETGLGLTNKKAENFGEWYSEVHTIQLKDLFVFFSFSPDLFLSQTCLSGSDFYFLVWLACCV